MRVVDDKGYVPLSSGVSIVRLPDINKCSPHSAPPLNIPAPAQILNPPPRTMHMLATWSPASRLKRAQSARKPTRELNSCQRARNTRKSERTRLSASQQAL